MGGPGTASLLSAIGGAGASTAGALTGKGDAGQPLVNLSQSLNQQDQQRAQLAQQAQQNALQLRRQEIQDARQNFYMQQAVKTGAREDARDVRSIENQSLMNTLRKDEVTAKNLKENRAIEKEARNTGIAAEALAVKNDPARNILKGIADGSIPTPQDAINRVNATIPKDKREGVLGDIMREPSISNFWNIGGQQFKVQPNGQPTQKILQYVPATKDTPAGVK